MTTMTETTTPSSSMIMDSQTAIQQTLLEIRRLATSRQPTALHQIWQLATAASDVIASEGSDPDPGLVARQPLHQLKHRLANPEAGSPLNPSPSSLTSKKDRIMNSRFSQAPRIVFFAIFLGLLAFNTWQSAQTQALVNQVHDSFESLSGTFKSMQSLNTPLSAAEVSDILKRGEGDCVKEYVQRSLAAGQVVLRGQVTPGTGSDACRLAAALAEQRAAVAQ